MANRHNSAQKAAVGAVEAPWRSWAALATAAYRPASSLRLSAKGISQRMSSQPQPNESVKGSDLTVERLGLGNVLRRTSPVGAEIPNASILTPLSLIYYLFRAIRRQIASF